MKAGMKRYIAFAAAMGLMVAALPQTVLSEDVSQKQVIAAEDADQKEARKEAEEKKEQERKAEEARKAAEAKKAADAQKVAEAQKAAEAQNPSQAEASGTQSQSSETASDTSGQQASEASNTSGQQGSETSGTPDQTIAGAPGTQSQPLSEASGSQGQPAAEESKPQSQPSTEEADTDSKDQSAAGSEVTADGEEASDAQDDGENPSEDPESEESAQEEAVLTPLEGADNTESEEEELEAADDPEADQYTYSFESATVAAPSLDGTYVLGDSVSLFPVPTTTYTIKVTAVSPEGDSDPENIVETITGGGTWQCKTSTSGWTDMSTIPSDKSEVHARYHMPAGTLSFKGPDDKTHEINVEAVDSEEMLLDRMYPQLFSPTIAQNGNNADYSFSLSGYPGISITLSLVNASGSQVGSATKTMSDLPSGMNVINHFFSSDWSVNLFGLKESDLNQTVRLMVTQNPVSGDAIGPCAPFYSNELFLVSAISGKVTIPSTIHIGDDVTADISGVKNPSKMTLTYQWYLGGKSVSEATDSTYTVSIEDLVAAGSKVLSCSVTDVLDKTLYSQEVTVLPLDLSAPNVDVDWEEEATYTGKKSFPKEISVTTTSYEVPEDMWKVTRVKGKNCVNPGKAWMKITGTSEYVINSRKVQYTIKGQSEKKETKAAKAAPADLTVTDSLGAPKKYEVRIIEEISQTEEQNAEQEEALAESVRIYEILTFDDNTVVGDTVYSQRNLHITRDMINKAKDAGCSSIRLRVADGGIDLAVLELSKDSYMVYFAPDDGRGASEDEKAVLNRYQPQGEIYRVSVRTNNEYGEDVDVIDTMLKARVLLYGDRDEQTQFLLLSHDTLEPTVNNAEKKSAGGDSYLSGHIFKRSLYTATLVD